MKKKHVWMIAALLCLGAAVGCSKNSTSQQELHSSGQEETQENPTEDPKYEFDDSKPALTVGYSGEIDSLNPFFADTYDSRLITSVTQAELLTTDRGGNVVLRAISGEEIVYKGTRYAYTGAANILVDWDESADRTTYTITLRSDLKFSDGTTADADDLIFTLYVLSDPTYDGPYTVSSLPIVGMKSYRSNAPADVEATQEEIAQALEEMPRALRKAIETDIVRVQLTKELDWCEDLFENSDYSLLTEQYASPEALFSAFYAREEISNVEEMEREELLETVIAQYGADYKALGLAYANDEAAFLEDAQELAESWLIEEKISQGLIGNAPNISGIQKVSDHQVVILTEGYDANAIYQLNIPIVPLSYYGDESQYDYENNQFGFPKEDLSLIRSRNDNPIGAGPYQFVFCEEDGTISMAANPHYYEGTPETGQLQFCPIPEEEKIAAVASGKADVVRIVGSIDNIEEIMTYNSNNSLSGDAILTDMVDDLAYGYIGIQAEQVCVEGEPGSDASRALRHGLAVVFSYFRQEAVGDYFGASANVIDYPMSQTLWASPQKSDSDYETAFSRDLYNNPIYTEDMTQEEQYDAMKKAALDYFRDAGYRVEEGVLTEAPQGAALAYEVLLVQEEGSTHPCASLMQKASDVLQEMGMTLTITYLQSDAQLDDILQSAEQQIWCGEYSAVMYPDLYEHYFSTNCPGMGGTNKNHFSIVEEDLDALILEAARDNDVATRKRLYKQCMDLILDWAVEIPVYQGTDNVLFCARRIQMDTVAEDITSYYSWVREIEQICLSLPQESGEEPSEAQSE